MLLARAAAAEPAEELIRVLVESSTKKALEEAIGELAEDEELTTLARGAYSATLTTATLRRLVKQNVPGLSISTKKRTKLRLDKVARDVELVASSPAARQVTQTGKNVFIGVVDSGFDLTHPMFRDAAGKLRVEALLVQRETTCRRDQEFTAASLQAELDAGNNPGFDEDGHGTHVASIAGGTKYKSFEGVAPEARFLLVKTNFLDTDKAVSWIFSQAGSAPCVINYSLGHHFGAHDGSDAEERLYDALTGPGKIIVVSAGNERIDDMHIGGRFVAGQTQTVAFDVLPSETDDPAEAGLTLWYASADKFKFALLSPSGQEFAVPATNSGRTHSASGATIRLMRGPYDISNLVQVQIQVLFGSASPSVNRLRNWRLRCMCDVAAVGRLDGWFFNSGYAQFRNHSLVEPSRTIGLPATSRGCIAVASHVSKVKWDSDDGPQVDSRSTVGASSEFSSLGPDSRRSGKARNLRAGAFRHRRACRGLAHAGTRRPGVGRQAAVDHRGNQHGVARRRRGGCLDAPKEEESDARESALHPGRLGPQGCAHRRHGLEPDVRRGQNRRRQSHLAHLTARWGGTHGARITGN